MDVSTNNDSNNAVDVMVQEKGLLSEEESLEVEDNVDEERGDYNRCTNSDLPCRKQCKIFICGLADSLHSAIGRL